jgi:hypothetical protein
VREGKEVRDEGLLKGQRWNKEKEEKRVKGRGE